MLGAAVLIGKAAFGRPKQKLPLVLQDLLSVLPGAIAVELPRGRRVFAPAGSDPLRYFLILLVASWITTS